MKRVWDEVSLGPVPGGQAVLLDGRPMRLPGSGTPLVLRQPGLAEAVAAEWRGAGHGRGGELRIEELPLTRLAATAQDRIAPDPSPVAAALAEYGESDLLCYRADRPAALVDRQAAAWQPWLAWAERTHGARLRLATGITHVAQPPEALRALRRAVDALDVFALAALGVAAPAMGSLVLGLALAAGELDAAAAHGLARLDEAFQNEQWGLDDEARRRADHMLAELTDCERFIRLTRP